MNKRIDSNLVGFILKNWENPNHAGEVQEIIEAIVAELKMDYRNYQRQYGRNNEGGAMFESLIDEVQSIEFWEKFDYMSGFSFPF